MSSPPILAISGGPTKGVHILRYPTFPLPRACTDGYDRSYPLAPGEQYRYRYPLMLHDTPESFPPTPAFGPEFARFDSLQNAMNWMKEQDAGEYMLEQFKGVGL